MAGAAAVIVRREKELVAHFREHRALTTNSAQSTNALQVDENIAFRILRERAIIREASPGLYYLDEPSWEASVRRRRRIAFILITAILAAGVAAFITNMKH
ncbi:MAG: hypothetical protein ABJB66_10290 [Gemmatimonadaceae bacterium]